MEIVSAHLWLDARDHLPNSLYTFETWGQQLLDFIEQKMGAEPTFIICNSVGGRPLTMSLNVFLNDLCT